MKLLSILFVLSSMTLAHVGDDHSDGHSHDFSQRWQRLPTSVAGVLKGKVREGKYSGLSYEFDKRQKTIIKRLSEKKVFDDNNYIKKESHLCELEVTHSQEVLKFNIKAKPVHYYERSPKENWKIAPRTLK